MADRASAARRLAERAGDAGLRLWQLPLVLILIAAILLSAVIVSPYQPFVVRSYSIEPTHVCPGQAVTATVTRRFTADVSSLTLSERWVTAEGRPVGGDTNTGTLPGSQLSQTGRFVSATSPLLTHAPDEAGTYRVRITAHFEGQRDTIPIPASGEAMFMSDNAVTVQPCGGRT